MRMVRNQKQVTQSKIFDHIVSTYRKFTAGELSSGVAEDKYAYVATREEIVENDYNLNIPRYVDTYEEEEEIDIVSRAKEIEFA